MFLNFHSIVKKSIDFHNNITLLIFHSILNKSTYYNNNLIFLSFTVSTGKVVRFLGIAYTLVGTSVLVGLPAVTILGLKGASGFPTNEVGVPVFTVSPMELIRGFIESPVIVFIKYPDDVFKETITGLGYRFRFSSAELFEFLLHPYNKSKRRKYFQLIFVVKTLKLIIACNS